MELMRRMSYEKKDFSNVVPSTKNEGLGYWIKMRKVFLGKYK